MGDLDLKNVAAIALGIVWVGAVVYFAWDTIQVFRITRRMMKERESLRRSDQQNYRLRKR